jgi:hypothetical protein
MPNLIELIDVETRSIKYLTDMFKNNTLSVDNTFQRRYVWLPRNRVSLVETILLGYPIPEIYLWQNDTDPETGETKFSIVDGQQRLRAVESFINNDFKLNTSGLEFKDADYARKAFNQLSPDQKSSIWKYKFSIRFLKEEVSREEIVKIFLRLNSTNTSLNPQELRNAEFNGEFIALAERISEYYFWSEFNVFNAGDLRRMLDIQFISTLLIFLRMGIEEETTQASINKAYDLYNVEYEEAEEDYRTTCDALDIIAKISKDSNNLKNIVKRKTHLYSLFVFAYFVNSSNIIVNEKIKESLNIWYGHYLNDTSYGEEKMDALLNEYRSLSLEGVQKKPNRQRRFDIIKEVCLEKVIQ